jgi:hypothetical protein
MNSTLTRALPRIILQHKVRERVFGGAKENKRCIPYRVTFPFCYEIAYWLVFRNNSICNQTALLVYYCWVV